MEKEVWRPVTAVGAKPEIQEEYKRMDDDMRVSLAAILSSFLDFIIPRGSGVKDDDITLLEGDFETAAAAGVFPRASINLEERKITVVTRVRTASPLRVLQRSPWHVWSDVFTSLFIELKSELRTRFQLTDFGKPLLDIAQIYQRIEKEGKFAIPALLLDSLTMEAQVMAMLGFAAFQDWLRDSEDARALLNLNMRIWQTNPPFEAVLMARMCEYMEPPQVIPVVGSLPSALPQSVPAVAPFDADWIKARPLAANMATPWHLHHVGETVSDLNVMWWPDHLGPEDKRELIKGLERLHSQASLMTQMLLRS